MKKLAVATVALIITGCAAARYEGPGTFQDIAEARSQCVREMAVVVRGPLAIRGPLVNGYVGWEDNQFVPKCSALRACLASKGYHQSRTGRFDTGSMKLRCN